MKAQYTIEGRCLGWLGVIVDQGIYTYVRFDAVSSPLSHTYFVNVGQRLAIVGAHVEPNCVSVGEANGLGYVVAIRILTRPVTLIQARSLPLASSNTNTLV